MVKIEWYDYANKVIALDGKAFLFFHASEVGNRPWLHGVFQAQPIDKATDYTPLSTPRFWHRCAKVDSREIKAGGN